MAFKYNPVSSRSTTTLPTYNGGVKYGKTAYAYHGKTMAGGAGKGLTTGVKAGLLLVVAAAAGFVLMNLGAGGTRGVEVLSSSSDKVLEESYPIKEPWEHVYAADESSSSSSQSAHQAQTTTGGVGRPGNLVHVPIESTGGAFDTHNDPSLFHKTPLKGPALAPATADGGEEEGRPDYNQLDAAQQYEEQVAAADKAATGSSFGGKTVADTLPLSGKAKSLGGTLEDTTRPTTESLSSYKSPDLKMEDLPASKIADPKLVEPVKTSAKANDLDIDEVKDEQSLLNDQGSWTTGKGPGDVTVNVDDEAPSIDTKPKDSWTLMKEPKTFASEETQAFDEEGAEDDVTPAEDVEEEDHGPLESSTKEKGSHIRVPAPGEAVRNEATPEEADMFAGSFAKEALSLAHGVQQP